MLTLLFKILTIIRMSCLNLVGTYVRFNNSKIERRTENVSKYY